MSADHDHGRAAPNLDDTRRRALWIALGLNGIFLVVEAVAGIAFGSLALLADATHMASDVAGLAIALGALALARRPASARNTYGLRRAEVLGAQLNSVLLLAAALWIVIEAVRRAGDDVSIDGAGVIVVATIGLVINVASAVVIARAAGRNLNMRAAWWHMTSDALGSVAAIIAGAAVVFRDATWVDLAASVLVAVLVAIAALSLLRDATRVLLEAAPTDLDPEAVSAALCEDPDVETVHHLHVWSLGSETAALSAHVVLRNAPDLHTSQGIVERLKHGLEARFDIDHATLEVECHDCESPGEPHASRR